MSRMAPGRLGSALTGGVISLGTSFARALEPDVEERRAAALLEREQQDEDRRRHHHEQGLLRAPRYLRLERRLHELQGLHALAGAFSSRPTSSRILPMVSKSCRVTSEIAIRMPNRSSRKQISCVT